MKKLNSLEVINDKIRSGNAIILYFSSKSCSVCNVLKTKVELEVSKNFDKIEFYEVSCDESLEIASNFGVFSAPTILFYLDTKEFLKVGRNISISSFCENIRRPYNMFYGD